MPTADSFTALGAGNGFPFCPSRVDVTDTEGGGDYAWEMWSTIDGYNKDSTEDRTVAGIIESKRLAMLYIWNTYQLTGEVVVSSDSVSNVNSEDHALHGDPDADPIPLPPKSRVCLPGNGGFGDYIEIEDADGNTVANLSIKVPLMVTAMYDGITSEEENFIGYGIADSTKDGIYAYSDDLSGFFDYVYVAFNCVALRSESDCFSDEFCTTKRDSQYTSISMGGETLHGVGVAEISNLEAGGFPTINGSTLSATTSFSSSDGGEIPVSIDLTSLTAYSY